MLHLLIWLFLAELPAQGLCNILMLSANIKQSFCLIIWHALYRVSEWEIEREREKTAEVLWNNRLSATLTMKIEFGALKTWHLRQLSSVSGVDYRLDAQRRRLWWISCDKNIAKRSTDKSRCGCLKQFWKRKTSAVSEGKLFCVKTNSNFCAAYSKKLLLLFEFWWSEVRCFKTTRRCAF